MINAKRLINDKIKELLTRVPARAEAHIADGNISPGRKEALYGLQIPTGWVYIDVVFLEGQGEPRVLRVLHQGKQFYWSEKNKCLI